MDGLEFSEFMPGRHAINFDGEYIGRVTDENGGCHEVIMVPRARYTMHPNVSEIIKACWEKARLLDITRRLMK